MNPSVEEQRKSHSWMMLGLLLAGSFLAAGVGTWGNFPNVREWYPTLNKPSWTPPSGLFAPVWSTLYVMMAVAVWRAWRTARAAGSLLRGYGVQLVLNALWSVLFFKFKQPVWGLVDIVVLLAVLLWMQRALWRADRLAGLFWLPYVLWVAFATALNAAIVAMN